MAIATFDTLKFASTRKAAGVPEKQAEAIAFGEVMQINFKELGYQGRLECDPRRIETGNERHSHRSQARNQRCRTTVDAKIDGAVSDLKVQITQVKGEQVLLRWMMGATFASGLAALGLLVRVLFVLPR